MIFVINWLKNGVFFFVLVKLVIFDVSYGWCFVFIEVYFLLYGSCKCFGCFFIIK